MYSLFSSEKSRRNLWRSSNAQTMQIFTTLQQRNKTKNEKKETFFALKKAKEDFSFFIPFHFDNTA